jgi:hypothetical protein
MLQTVLIAVLWTSSAQAPEPKTKKAPAKVVIAKQDWIEALRTALPGGFCAPEEYFRQCFTVTEDECLSAARLATKSCLAELEDKIPAKLVQPEDGTEWGGKVGSCAGMAFERQLTKKRKNTKKCNDASNWQ